MGKLSVRSSRQTGRLYNDCQRSFADKSDNELLQINSQKRRTFIELICEKSKLIMECKGYEIRND